MLMFLKFHSISTAASISAALLLAAGAELAFLEQREQRLNSTGTDPRPLEMSEVEKLREHEAMLREWGMPMTRRDVVRDMKEELTGLNRADWLAKVDHEMRVRGFDLDINLKLRVEIPGEAGDEANENELANSWTSSAAHVVNRRLASEEIRDNRLKASEHMIALRRKIDDVSLREMRPDEYSINFPREYNTHAESSEPENNSPNN